MKVLYINTLYSPHIGGGAEITLKTLVEAIQKTGCEVAVLTTGPDAEFHEDLVEGVRVLRVGIENIYWHFNKIERSAWQRGIWHLRDIYNRQMKRRVEQIIKQEKPDVVSCHNLSGFSVSTWSALKCTGTPFVQVLHDLYNLCPNSNMFQNGHSCGKQCLHCKLFRFFHPKLSNCVPAVVGVSQFILEKHLQNALFRNAKIQRVIYNARRLKVTNHKKWQSNDNRVRFGFLGTLTQAKGIELLLQVFSKIKKTNTELFIAGSGKPAYVKHLKERFTADNIHFLGYTPPENFFKKIDVLIVPSLLHDTLPGVIIESLTFAVPVIGSRRGGIPEMIEHGKNGFLFEPSRPEELSAIILRIAKNPGVLENLIPEAFGSVRPFIDIARWTGQWLTLYKRVKFLT